MKKNISYILAMILMIPFFVLAALSIGSEGRGKGKEILNNNMSWTVVKEDGVLDSSEGMPVDFTIEKDGRYKLSFAWDVEDPGFLTAMTIKDEAGNCVYNTSAFQLSISNESIFLEKGNYIINTEFFTTEDAFKEYANTNNAFASEGALDDYLKAVAFDTFAPNSEARFNFEVKLNQTYTAPVWIKILCAATGLIIIALCVLNFINDRKKGDNIKEGMDNTGIIYSIFSMAVTCVQVFLTIGASLLPVEMTNGGNTIFTLAIIVISVDLIGFPITYALMKKMPKRDVPTQKIGFFGFLPFIFMAYAIMIPGSLVGNIIDRIITLPFGGGGNVLEQILTGTGLLPRIIVVGILAPIFEELIFRKLIIDHLGKYGTFLAIVVSGLFFGLFHGNFQQFFYAAGLGFLFAFIYSKTGKIHLTIILHMIINTVSSLVSSLIMQVTMVNPNMDFTPDFLTAHPEAVGVTALYGLYLVALVLFAFIGFIFFIIFLATKRFKLAKVEGEPTKSESLKTLFTSKYAWLFIVSAAGLFIMYYLPIILGI